MGEFCQGYMMYAKYIKYAEIIEILTNLQATVRPLNRLLYFLYPAVFALEWFTYKEVVK